MKYSEILPDVKTFLISLLFAKCYSVWSLSWHVFKFLWVFLIERHYSLCGLEALNHEQNECCCLPMYDGLCDGQLVRLHPAQWVLESSRAPCDPERDSASSGYKYFHFGQNKWLPAFFTSQSALLLSKVVVFFIIFRETIILYCAQSISNHVDIKCKTLPRHKQLHLPLFAGYKSMKMHDFFQQSYQLSRDSATEPPLSGAQTSSLTAQLKGALWAQQPSDAKSYWLCKTDGISAVTH